MLTRSWVFLVVSASALDLFFPVHFARGQCRVNEAAKLTASDAAADDLFGLSVSISGDVAVVGALFDDDAGDDSGSAYVYRFDGSMWIEEQKLTASDGAAGDEFGGSVSISGNMAVVGAVGNDRAAYRSGFAYAYRFDGSTWIEEQKLTAWDGAAWDDFGTSVSVSGDVAVVGARGDDGAGSGSGSAYVYRFDGNTWVEEQELTASDGARYDHFGISVSVSGDVVMIGSYGDDDMGSYSGSVYVYRFDGSTWVEEQKLTASDGAQDDWFGRSVSLSGNAGLVGAWKDDDAPYDSGSAYVYRFDGSTWVQEQKLTASDGAPGDSFGWSVSISGGMAAVGAFHDDDAGGNSGSAYLYRFNGSTWGEEQKLTASDAAGNDRFGCVSLSAHVAMVGAWWNDDGGHSSGSAYVFGINPVPSDPPCGAIDARQPSEPDGSEVAGWSSVALTFDEPLGEMNAEDFAVVISPPGDAPTVADVTTDGNTATVQFDDFIPTEAWTTITHWPTGAVTRIGCLPADVNNDKLSNSGDILFMIDVLNGIVDPTPPLYQTDTDRSAQANPADILRVIDLLNGAGVYEVWNWRSLPE